MLPRQFSENLCSLLPNKTRLGVSVFWEMNMDVGDDAICERCVVLFACGV